MASTCGHHIGSSHTEYTPLTVQGLQKPRSARPMSRTELRRCARGAVSRVCRHMPNHIHHLPLALPSYSFTLVKARRSVGGACAMAETDDDISPRSTYDNFSHLVAECLLVMGRSLSLCASYRVFVHRNTTVVVSCSVAPNHDQIMLLCALALWPVRIPRQ